MRAPRERGRDADHPASEPHVRAGRKVAEQAARCTMFRSSRASAGGERAPRQGAAAGAPHAASQPPRRVKAAAAVALLLAVLWRGAPTQRRYSPGSACKPPPPQLLLVLAASAPPPHGSPLPAAPSRPAHASNTRSATRSVQQLKSSTWAAPKGMLERQVFPREHKPMKPPRPPALSRRRPATRLFAVNRARRPPAPPNSG